MLGLHIKNNDVKTYVLSHSFPSGPLATSATLKVISIDLITGKESSASDSPTGAKDVNRDCNR
jgi:hypothetical protein